MVFARSWSEDNGTDARIAPTEIAVTFETSKVAVSGLIGTVAGVQFSGVFQSLLTGLRFQIALSARTV